MEQVGHDHGDRSRRIQVESILVDLLHSQSDSVPRGRASQSDLRGRVSRSLCHLARTGHLCLPLGVGVEVVVEEAVGSPSSLVVCLVHTMARVTECRMTFRRICRWRLALLVCLLSGGRACAAVGADVRLLGDLGCAASVVYFAWIVLVAASSSTPVGDRRPYRDTCRRICRRLRSRVLRALRTRP